MDTSSCPHHRAIPPDPWMWPSYIQMHTYAHNPWETYGSQTFPTRAATCQLPALPLETLSNPPRTPHAPTPFCPGGWRAGPATHLPLLSYYFLFHINRSCRPGRAPATHWGGTAPERQRAHRLPWSSVRKRTTGRGREHCHAVGLQKSSPPTWD